MTFKLTHLRVLVAVLATVLVLATIITAAL